MDNNFLLSPLPLELVFEILAEVDDKDITSVASLNKSHLDCFKRPNGLYQRLVSQICVRDIKGNLWYIFHYFSSS